MTVIRRPASLLLVAALLAGCGPTAAPASPASAPRPTLSPTPTATPVPTPSPRPTPTATPSPTPTPSVLPAALTGVVVDRALANRLPLAAMIDDSRAARPQSGFNGASLVFQATADGYESRYLLIFQERETGAIGPVRSARFFFVQWSQEVAAAIAHYGGDRKTRSYLRWKVAPSTDVDGLGRGNPAFHRIKSRKAPHNAYTSTKDLRRQAEKLGAAATLPDAVHRRPFIDPSPLEQRAAAQRIRIPYHTNIVTYTFDRDGDRYLRSIDGKPHIDPADDRRVAPTNVVVLFQKFRIDTKIEPGHSRPDIKSVGKGKALVFREGRVVEATWRKADDTAPTLIVDEAGTEIPLVRGQTFIQVVPLGTKVRYGD